MCMIIYLWIWIQWYSLTIYVAIMLHATYINKHLECRCFCNDFMANSKFLNCSHILNKRRYGRSKMVNGLYLYSSFSSLDDHSSSLKYSFAIYHFTNIHTFIQCIYVQHFLYHTILSIWGFSILSMDMGMHQITSLLVWGRPALPTATTKVTFFLISKCFGEVVTL